MLEQLAHRVDPVGGSSEHQRRLTVGRFDRVRVGGLLEQHADCLGVS